MVSNNIDKKKKYNTRSRDKTRGRNDPGSDDENVTSTLTILTDTKPYLNRNPILLMSLLRKRRYLNDMLNVNQIQNRPKMTMRMMRKTKK